MAGVEKGLGGLNSTAYSDPAYELQTQFRHNIQAFAAFKNHEEISQLVKLLKDDKGAVRSFSDFKKVAEPVIGQYNDNYLDAERNHALASAQMSDKWLEFEENKKRFPYLQYKTQKDERVRDAHKELDGVTLPVDHEFWNNFLPPNGWKCRCFLKQTDKMEQKIKDGDLPSFEQVPSVFRNNAARSGELFTEEHPYFKGIKSGVAQNIVQQKNEFVYNSFTPRHEQLTYNKKTGGYAVKHKSYKGDTKNENTAKLLANQGYGVELVKHAKNAPDAIIDGTVWAFVQLSDPKNTTQAIKQASKRSKRVLLVLPPTKGLDINSAIAKGVEGTAIKEVGILNGKDLDTIITE